MIYLTPEGKKHDIETILGKTDIDERTRDLAIKILHATERPQDLCVDLARLVTKDFPEASAATMVERVCFNKIYPTKIDSWIVGYKKFPCPTVFPSCLGIRALAAYDQAEDRLSVDIHFEGEQDIVGDLSKPSRRPAPPAPTSG